MRDGSGASTVPDAGGGLSRTTPLSHLAALSHRESVVFDGFDLVTRPSKGLRMAPPVPPLQAPPVASRCQWPYLNVLQLRPKSSCSCQICVNPISPSQGSRSL